jgi:SAM-dependent methyltransferase
MEVAGEHDSLGKAGHNVVGEIGGKARKRMDNGRRTAACLFVLVLPILLSACADLKRWAYQGFGRDRWQKPEEVIRALEIGVGQQVADIGAGSGYFTFRLALAVGDSGKVYAVDVDEEMIDYLKKRVRQVVPIAARPDDPQLPEGSIDLLFVCNTYHHIESRPAYFQKEEEKGTGVFSCLERIE